MPWTSEKLNVLKSIVTIDNEIKLEVTCNLNAINF